MANDEPMRRQIDSFVDTLAPNGEWSKDASRREFVRRLTHLVMVYKMPFEDAKNMLEALYNAVAAEYGD